MNLFLLVAIVLGFAAIGVGLMHAVRRSTAEEHLLGQVEHGSGIFAAIATTFAVVLAFVVLVAFDDFNEARTAGETEAGAVLELSRTANFFPASERKPLEDALLCYARAVADDEWPLLADGERSPLVDHWQAEVRDGFLALDPRTPRETNAHLQLLGEQDSRLDGRRVRIAQATREIPAPIWFVLALGGALTIGFLLLFADRRESFLVQGSMMAAVSALVAGSLLLVWFLDHPYSGAAGSIEPTEIELSAKLIADENTGSPPCTGAGARLASSGD